MSGLAEPTPISQYTLYEMLNKTPSKILAHFDMLTGGDQVISMVTYNVIDDKGNVTTKVMPGQTTFEPLLLLRAMDVAAEEIVLLFEDAVAGKLKTLRRNYSVSMNDANGNPLVWWHLYNALPLKVSGFDFNMKTESTYTSFEITLQAELIDIDFDKGATSDAVAAALEHWAEAQA
jgi:phage tail-like protein